MNSSMANLPSNVLGQLCRLVISALPADDWTVVIKSAERPLIAEQMGFKSTAELNKNVEILFDFWRKALYHSAKATSVRSDFEQAGVDSETATQISSIWLEEGAKVMPKAKALSRSGIPSVNDIRWTLNLERATKTNPVKREPYVNLQFETETKKQCVRLSLDELKKLHVDLRNVQNKVDSVFK